MRRLIDGVLWLVGLTVVLYVYFLVPIGERTLFQHTLRIAATEPAKELGRELGDVGARLKDRAVEEGRRSIDEWRAQRELEGDSAEAGSAH
ncbi:MAG: hypothetical protein ACFCGT_09610 [Sandaracinaceae bacterium]